MVRSRSFDRVGGLFIYYYYYSYYYYFYFTMSWRAGTAGVRLYLYRVFFLRGVFGTDTLMERHRAPSE